MKKRKVNRHHIIYSDEKHLEQEWVETIFAGEHKVITLMSWYSKKSVSKGFIRALEFFILKNKHKAIELEKEEKS